MPIIKSAKKALKQQIRRGKENDKTRRAYKSAIKKFKKEPIPKNLSRAYSKIDRATKKNVIHKNKAARLKAQLSKFTTKTPAKKKSSSKSPAKKRTKTKKNKWLVFDINF